MNGETPTREDIEQALFLLITQTMADSCTDYDGAIPLPSFCRVDCEHLHCYHQPGKPDKLLCVRGPNALDWTATWLDKASCCPLAAEADRTPGAGLNLNLLRTTP